MNVIGIAVRIEKMEENYKYFCNSAYIEAIISYGWTPLLLPTTVHIEEVAQLCDALLLPGGYDIASYYYKEPQHPNATLYDYPIDHYDFKLLAAFVQAKKPILGICRGMQLINVFFGGSLYQDINLSSHVENSHEHLIFPQSNTIFEQLLAPQSKVNSFHHQAVSKLADDLLLGAYTKDKMIEAFQHKVLPILGVQWHPEKLKQDPIFPYFLDVLC